MSFRYRMDYAKLEGMRYTSNLDIHKMWERTFRRAKLPLVYSQGFHPQPKIQQANPLPLGFLSNNELVDFYLQEENSTEILEKTISIAIPDGIKINSIQQISSPEDTLQKQTQASEYFVYFLETVNFPEIETNIENILGKDEIIRTRRGKTYDLRPLIISLELCKANDGFLKMVLSSRDGMTGRPDEVIKELSIQFELTRIIRNKIIL
ncbi:MAG TPA: TIGR03936 family radical SAM-associated protein, partial [Anaerolineaceae bacterium]|nr:TIGR03936 family radical SAM-associated protein [Anaerolineaceae bacterium]